MPTYESLLQSLIAQRAAVGNPPTRAIASQAGVSHTAVADLFKGERVSWRTAEKIINAIGGNPDDYADSWPMANPQANTHAPRATTHDLLGAILAELRTIRELLERT